MTSEIADLQKQLRDFARERDWEQFHSPKNIASALIVEAAELLEIFQWLTEKDSSSLDTHQHERTKEELADVFLYSLRLADLLKIDLVEAANSKLQSNAIKYPVDLSKGNAKKYTELGVEDKE